MAQTNKQMVHPQPRTIKKWHASTRFKKMVIPLLITIIALLFAASAINLISIIAGDELQELINDESTANHTVAKIDPTAIPQLQNTLPSPIIKINSTVQADTLPTAQIAQVQEGETSLVVEPLVESSSTQLADKTIDNGTTLSSTSAPNQHINSTSASPLVEENSPISLETPTRKLLLPTVDVASSVIDIPIVNGNWDVSELNDDSGILEGFASHPDHPGAMVVAAHATTQWPKPGPFADLRLMNLGDPIIFQIDGIEYVYEISRFLRVDISNVNILNKYGQDGIVLVTCGDYNFLTGEYGARLVAYGDLLEVRTVSNS